MLRACACRRSLQQVYIGVQHDIRRSFSASTSRVEKSSPTKEQDRDEQRAFFPVAPSVDKGQRHRTQYNVDPFSPVPAEEHYTFPLVTSADLAKSKERPRKVRMLARDFIDDSLYNPHYGYFSRHAVLLPDGAKRNRGYEFNEIRSDRDFMAAVEERYSEFEESLKEKDDIQRSKRLNDGPGLAFTKDGMEAAQSRGRFDAARQAQSEKEAGEHDRDVKAMAARQVWHTPTELFKPYYAHAIARYILETFSKNAPDDSLHIYEVGAGSGALAVDILNFLARDHPQIYRRTRYTIIEISSRLAKQQKSVLQGHIEAGRAEVVNSSIFDYSKVDNKECFFIALEVLDNLAHDVLRYSTASMQPYQALISIDGSGDMHELWEPVQDERIKRYLNMTTRPSTTPATIPSYLSWLPESLRKSMTNHLPFYPNLSPPHYIPTGSLALMEVLASKFPHHHKIISDFNALPDALTGLNAPVVQTRLEGTMIPVTTYTVQQGFFDIFFPTDFRLLQSLHDRTVQDEPASMSTIMDHRAFLEKYADTSKTACKDGSNPMLSWYANASWFLS